MLSNTAVPKYYGEFRNKVLHGEIKVCETISMEMNRIDKLIEDKGVYYDPDKVEGWIHFCENELTLTNGKPVKLLDTFKLWAEQIFGWYYLVERQVYEPGPHSAGRWVKKMIVRRLTHKQYLIVARGAAKSIYSSFIQSYFLTIDGETTHQFAIAPTMAQADEILRPMRIAITKARGPVYKLLTHGSINNTTGSRANRPKLMSTKRGIENFATGSLLEVRPMSISKVQGYRNKCVSVDEWLSGDYQEDVIGAIEQGAGKDDSEYLILCTSSEGTVRNRAGDNIKMELMNILRGEYKDPHTSIFYYKLDDINEIENPSMWIKANPNLGITVQYDVYHTDVERAKHVPSAKNDIYAKRFGIPLEGFTYFFPYEETIPVDRKLDFSGMACAMGGDLSMGDDFCAFTFLFPLKTGQFGVKARSYISEYTLNKLPEGFRVNVYEPLIEEGTLIIMPGTVLEMGQIYEDLDEFIERMQYDIRAFGFDPWYSKEFISRWVIDHSQFELVKVPQGARTESVPLGEIKKLSERRDLVFDQKILSFTMGNAIVSEDTNGNRKLIKRRREDKIDNVSAMMDAYIAYKDRRDSFE